MKNQIFPIIAFIIGLLILLYPAISNSIIKINQEKAVIKYREQTSILTDEIKSELLESAREYNKKLLKKRYRYHFSDEDNAEYMNLLKINGYEMMGVLEIPKINVTLPIYHGTSENVLQAGIGHFKGTSLPVGGIGSHAVITGHSGIPSSVLLTDLNEIIAGDIFIIHILNETLFYKVDQITDFLPDAVKDNILIEPDKDYCTIITCTPYLINSRRLFVRGYRIKNL